MRYTMMEQYSRGDLNGAWAAKRASRLLSLLSRSAPHRVSRAIGLLLPVVALGRRVVIRKATAEELQPMAGRARAREEQGDLLRAYRREKRERAEEERVGRLRDGLVPGPSNELRQLVRVAIAVGETELASEVLRAITRKG